jgi:transposase
MRQKHELRRSHRQIARSIGVSAGAVGGTLKRAEIVGLDWATVKSLTEDEVEQRLYGPKLHSHVERPMPDPAAMHLELRRAGVTLQLLHLEYLERHPDGYRYTTFCKAYNDWLERQAPSMRQVHVAGDKCFVDYSGSRPHIVDPKTGVVTEVELFVAVLGASNLTFARATHTQRVHDFIGANVDALEYFGGVPRAIVPDQLKSAVTKSCRYEPGLQRTYEEMAQHYGTVIAPARPRKPRDKAKVEVAVQVAQRWILARLRNETHFSLASLNERIEALTEGLNDRPMRTYGASRRGLFERLERATLSPLPASRYEIAEWQEPKVNIDYHIEFEDHYYSVPHQENRERVEVRATLTTVEILLRGRCIAVHPRSRVRGGFTTKPEHMPSSHRAHSEWTPSRMIGWASTIGEATAALVERILTDRPHPEHGYRSCLGILRLSKKYGHDRLEAACARAMKVGARSYRHIASTLEHGLDRVPTEESSTTARPTHQNVRGRDYYH